jgi:conjugative relaxase-like TrwC/TraI family protein
MLSIARIGRGQERYYLDKVAKGAEEYYTHGGEAPGRWWGGGASALGLLGVVDEDDIAAVLDGINPDDHVALVQGAGSERRRVGFDLTFSAPKGVSLLAMMGTAHIAGVTAAAHDDAVAQALSYLEANAAFTRRGHGGAKRMGTSGFVGAAFVHRSSRAADPQLHTHVLVANLVHGNDGRWSSLDARGLFGYGRTAGFVYQAVLRANLTRDLGLRWAPVRSGMAEPAGFSTAQLRQFSTRRAQIEAALDEYGASSAKAAQVAAYRTREAKDLSITPESLAERWAVRAAEVGLDQEAMAAMCGPGRVAGLNSTTAEVFSRLLSPAGLTATDAAFDERDVIRALAESAPDGITLDELSETTAVLLADPEVVALGASDPRTSTPLYSTVDMLAIEAALLAGAQRRQTETTSVVSQGTLEAVLAARPSLADEQAHMVRTLTTSGAGVEVVIGVAGTGKTFALEAARAAWSAAGYQVIGTALAKRTADGLGVATGMASGTVARLLIELERSGPQGRLAPNTVIVLDEAGMVGTRTMANLAAIAERDGAKLVLVGDPRQLPEIQAGGALAALASQLGAIELQHNRRQDAAWERAALAELRAGAASVAVGAYEDKERIVLAASAEAARTAMVAHWWEAQQAGASVAMMALRHSEVDGLNQAARVLMTASGALGEQREFAGKAFAVGDEVLALRNDTRLEVANGTRASVEAFGPDGSMTLRCGDDRTITLPASYVEAGHLTYGYAMTIHKAQGATVDRAFVLGSDALYREAGYVGMSRATTRSDIYVVAPEPDPEAHGYGPTQPTAQAALTAALETSRAKTMASELVGTDGGRAPIDGAAVVEMEAESARLGAALLPSLVPDPTNRITAWENERAAVGAVLVPDSMEARAALTNVDTANTQPLRPFDTAEQVSDRLRRWATDELARLDAQGAELEGARQAREAWKAEHVNDLASLAAIRASLDRARSVLGRAMLAAPGPHLVELLGPVPLREAPRAAWAAAAVEVETYRARFGISGPDLGERPGPEQGLQSSTWEATMRAVEVVRGRGGLDPARNGPEMDIGRSR